jgi:hypothetical protein
VPFLAQRIEIELGNRTPALRRQEGLTRRQRRFARFERVQVGLQLLVLQPELGDQAARQ